MVQCNAQRAVSTTAKVDKDSIQARPCFLCKENQPKGSKLLFLGVLAITIFLAVLSYRLLSIYLTTYPEKINNVSVTEGAHASEWELFTNEQGEVKPLSTDNGYSFTSLDFEGQTYYMSRVITETYEDAMIRIGAVTSQISVFLDGKLLYTDNGDGDNRIGYVTLGAVPADMGLWL